MNWKAIKKIVWAILRATVFPHDIYKRDAAGQIVYEKVRPLTSSAMGLGDLTTQPITVPVPEVWASIIAKVISLIVSIAALLFFGDQIDLATVEKLLRLIFGES